MGLAIGYDAAAAGCLRLAHPVAAAARPWLSTVAQGSACQLVACPAQCADAWVLQSALQECREEVLQQQVLQAEAAALAAEVQVAAAAMRCTRSIALWDC